jgi:hypothetical protein
LATEKQFTPPPQELIERWVDDSKSKPTLVSAHNYIAYKSAEWGFNSAKGLDPASLKARALRGLDRIQGIDVVSVWVGKDVFDTIKEALYKLPD